MLRRSDAENVAPPGARELHARSRKPLSLRTQPNGHTPAATKPQSANSKPAAAPRRRRALGDITNKGRAAPATTLNPALNKSHAVTRVTPPVVDEPEIFPAPLPRPVYEPVALEFSPEELVLLDESPDDGFDLLGRPLVQTEWDFKAAPLDDPLPRVASVESFEGRLDEFACIHREDARFTRNEFLVEDDFTRLELA